ncbi:hypothetical protein COCC4DRAFT_67855 [Bipolaris maydis ATCC 48331]|uniref:Uncharacterized protein n=2 Tax=Cochliobolus heterostrophus TaxID=5016 RepID=M2V7U3_COCH5|nr:uncharacterized protein COCC4DRAFT_67855 [Bipolaris maydis ATCC 48331]EMD96087.1 hypothetical protein COCHEDRAFT_1191207 [Bipolaris maydis C5]ENI10947.1 hypothetical protein COCC4DRAFT_67855 [Bipolaris maydis ATCC 48331]
MDVRWIIQDGMLHVRLSRLIPQLRSSYASALRNPGLAPRLSPVASPLQPMARATSDRCARKQCPLRSSYRRPTRTRFLSLHEWGSVESDLHKRLRVRPEKNSSSVGVKGRRAKSLEMWRDAYYSRSRCGLQDRTREDG